MFTRIGYVAAAVFALVVFSLAHGADREVIKEKKLEPFNLATEGSRNEKSGRKYISAPLAMKKGQLFEMHIYSYDHQPQILIRATDAEGKATGDPVNSKPETPYLHPETKRMVYWTNVFYVARADGAYKVFVTHAPDTPPGSFDGNWTLFDKEKETGAELRPAIAGYEAKSWGDPVAQNDGTARAGTSYLAGRDMGLKMYGHWVPTGTDARADWDALARLGGGNELSRKNLVTEEAVGNVVYRTWVSGGKDIFIVSPTGHAYVQLQVFPKFAGDEGKFVDAGKRMLAELENRAAAR